MAQILKISSSYAPPPPEGFVSPMGWGSTPNILERFGAVGIASEAISWERDSYIFDFKGSAEEFVDTFRQFYGPTMNAFDAAAQAGRTDELRTELVTLFQSQNQSQYPNTCLIAATFLRVTVEVD